MVEIFKTSVQEEKQASRILAELSEHFPELRINFDLDDCDKILRVEGKEILAEEIIRIVKGNGIDCGVLE